MTTHPCLDAVLKCMDMAEAHLRSEYVHDLAGTMATVGAHPHYSLTASPGVVSVVSGRDGVAAFYEAAHEIARPAASRFLTQIATDWYLFAENVPTRTWMADGSPRVAHTATLFIEGADGLVGEFVWERPSFDRPTDTAPLPMASLRSVTLHETLLAAISAGDAAAIEALLDPECTWAERDYLSDAEGGAILELRGAAAAAAHLAQWHRRFRPERVSVLNRQATDWYVFAEELWIVRPGGGDRRQVRKAVIYPVGAAGSLRGVIGFGRGPEAPSALADLCLGQAFWPETGERDTRRTRTPLDI